MTLHETLDPPVNNPLPAASFHDLMASVGYLLFQWSLLDRSLDAEIAHLRRAYGDVLARPCRARTVNERLAEWRALIGRGRRRATDPQAVESIGLCFQDLQRIRNLVATGFASATADGGEAAIACSLGVSRHGVADEVRMTIGDILNAIDAMELCRSELALLRDLAQ